MFDGDEPLIPVMLSILFASLFAVSFPTVSKQVPFLRIPGIVFFIGKHFGTGVILATAFIHLLDDAFRSLQNDQVTERYGKLGKYTGSIILLSLLSIFLVEYISTSFVEHLQDNPSAPPTPATSPRSPISAQANASTPQANPLPTIDENTPLLHPTLIKTPSAPVLPVQKRSETIPVIATQLHHHYHPHPQLPAVPIEVLTNSPRICRLAIAHDHLHGHHGCKPHSRDVEQQEHIRHHGEEDIAHEHMHEQEQRPKIGRRRQVVGLLVLQLGIMIHSLVIGLTLSVTTGSDFTSLTTAIIFHQVFEGLSLGIRIAALPPAHKHKHDHGHKHDGSGRIPQSTEQSHGNLPSPSPTPTSGGSSPSSVRSESQSPQRARNSLIGKWKKFWCWMKQVEWLKPTMTILFGVTTPFGMGLGMILWKRQGAGEDAPMLLIQGVMSAISAGMLIYASTVEMIAGDFVFGDVEGHHHHHHHEHEGHGPEHESGSAGGDATGDAEARKDQQQAQKKLKTTVYKRALALLSLFAGSGAMVLVGLGE
ncbi:Zinc/iron permease [Agrocybe pediades]|nr:Zinc/iron permease [Agrocybe pediades]